MSHDITDHHIVLLIDAHDARSQRSLLVNQACRRTQLECRAVRSADKFPLSLL